MANTKPKKFKSSGSRWGPGKVHFYYYSQTNKVWHPACTGPFRDYHGEILPKDSEEPVTCKKCNPYFNNKEQVTR